SKAQSTAMPNDLVREEDPLLGRNDFHQVLLNLGRIRVPGEFEAPGDSCDMRIDHHADTLLEPGAQNDVSGFACNARQCEKLVHLLGNLPAKVADNLLGGTHDRFRFVTEEAGRPDIRLQVFWSESSKILNRRIFLKNDRCYFVHVYVGGLSGEDGCNQQFPRVAVGQGASDVRISLIQYSQNRRDS